MHQSVAGLSSQLLQANVSVSSLEEGSLDNLYPAIVQCFGIIALGFIAGKLNLISNVEAKGLGVFVGSFSLPALVFVSLCQLDFSIVNWTFMASIALAKASIFFTVLLVSMFISQPTDLSKSGLFAIFVTASNDFALGFPVLNAIYGSTHPQYPMYLYLLAPISLVFLNPLGLIFMEIGKSNKADQSGATVKSKRAIAKKVILSLLKNPLLTMTLFGVLGNLLFHGSMPDIIHQFMETLGSAFSASALFLLGLRMVGQSEGGRASSPALSLTTPFVLITMKSLVLPLVAREVVSQLDAGRDANETLDLSNYAFLYGTIPTAPTVFVFASSYSVLPDMTANAITCSTFMAAPIMFITAKLLTLMHMNPSDYVPELNTFLLDVAVAGLLAALWVVLNLLITRKARQLPHSITLLLAIFQGTACIGALLWALVDRSSGWMFYTQFLVFGLGVLGSRVCTGVLAVALLLLQTKSACVAAKWGSYLVLAAILLPATMVLSLAVLQATLPPHQGQQDPNFQYGKTQAVLALVVLVGSLFTTLLCLIISQRHKAGQESSHRTGSVVGASETDALLTPESESRVEIEDLVLPPNSSNGNLGACGSSRRQRCDSTQREYCSGLIRRYEAPPAEEAVNSDNIAYSDEEDEWEIFQHNLLLLLLCVSMFVGAALCIWTLFMDQFSGIYLELVFFDGFLNLGQSIFTFALFGINIRALSRELSRHARRLLYGQEQLMLPPWEDLEPTTRAVSTMFIKHHLATAMDQVLHDGLEPGDGVRSLLVSLPAGGVVQGDSLVTWLVERGLVHSRQDGETFGRHLLRGRVIRHVHNHLDFYDSKTLYTFSPAPTQHQEQSLQGE